MAKKRTPAQLKARKIIKDNLNALGEQIYQEARVTSRKKTGRLRNSINYRVKPDTVLTLAQVFYGKYQQPNELLVSLEKQIGDTNTIIITEVNDQILSNFKIKK